MNVKALALAGATIGVAVVTLVTLNLVAPITQADEGHAPGIAAESVFAASLAEPGEGAATGELEVAQAEPATPASAEPEPAPSSVPAPAGGSCSMAAPASSEGAPLVVAGTGTVDESVAAPAEVAESAAMEVAQAESEPAAEPAAEPAYDEPAAESAPAEPAAIDSEPYAAAETVDTAPIGGEPAVAAGSCSTGVVDPSQPPVVVMASGLPGESAAPAGDVAGTDGGSSDFAAPAEDFSAAPVDTMPAAEPEPAPAPEPAAAVAESEPAVDAAPAPKPKPKPKASSAPKVQPADTQLVWWPAKTDGKLNITYAGSASFTKAIALIFDGAHADGSKANQSIKVTTKSGTAVEGQWLVAKGNPQMLLYSVPPGIYRVSVGADMSDKGDRTVPAASSGLVYVP